MLGDLLRDGLDVVELLDQVVAVDQLLVEVGTGVVGGGGGAVASLRMMMMVVVVVM